MTGVKDISAIIYMTNNITRKGSIIEGSVKMSFVSRLFCLLAKKITFLPPHLELTVISYYKLNTSNGYNILFLLSQVLNLFNCVSFQTVQS